MTAAELGKGIPGFITAQSRGQPNDTNGFVFNYCLIQGTGSAYLGRPNAAYARVLFYKSELPSLIIPEGWDAGSATGHE